MNDIEKSKELKFEMNGNKILLEIPKEILLKKGSLQFQIDLV